MFDNFLGWKVSRMDPQQENKKNKKTRQINKKGEGNQMIHLRFQTGE